MDKCEQSMRALQNAQGGWSYQSLEKGKPLGSTTCAGILSIALHAGVEVSLPTANAKSSIYLGTILDEDSQIDRSRDFILSMLHANCNEKGGDTHVTYFLWSVQEVAEVLSWRKWNGEDWYDRVLGFSLQNKTRMVVGL
ncbi:MAG: hypothetical protein QM703_13030 [Gemmatales bacterium]